MTLDPPGDNGNVITDAEVEQFVARYLNAARLPETDLTRWLESAPHEPPPVACSGCEHHAKCHEAFGERGSIGLYPLSSVAVQRMVERASPEGFSPRFVIKDVLKTVLVSYIEELRTGQFPPPALLDHFKNSRLSPTLKDELKRRDPNPVTRDRRLTLIDLWTTSERVIDLRPGVHEAFNLPPLGTTPPTPPLPPPKPVPTTTGQPATEAPRVTPPPGLPQKLESQLRQLVEWENDVSPLPQNLTQDLRVALFNAIHSRINWDAEILVEGHFSSTTDPKKPFRQRSINFERQLGQRQQAIVQLTVPLDRKSFTDAALAIQGMLLFSHYGHWRFQYAGQSGSSYFRKYAQQLDGWAQAVIDQIRRPTKAGAAWNPAPAAAELLALAARKANKPVASKTSTDEQLSALFEKIENVECDHRSASWKELFKTLQANHQAIKDTLRFHIGCTKGGSKQVQFIDAAQIIEPLRLLRKDWRPKEAIPEDAWDMYAPLCKAREKVDFLLTKAIEEEQLRHVAWVDGLRHAIGVETTRDQLVAAVKDVMQAARDEGVFAGVKRERLEQALDAFSRVRLDQCIEAIARIRAETDHAALLIELGRDYRELMTTADEFITLTSQFLEGSRKRVETEVAQLEGAGELKAAKQAIAQSLDQMFPNRPWQIAPTLVADYRFARRHRRYPRRHIPRAKVLERLNAELRLPPLHRQAISSILREGEPDQFFLAEFQYQATRRMLLDLEARSSRGLIIGASTGTGKTLAFYLPALTHIASLIERSANWTKAIAIYPRNELLKDQFSETYAQARRLDALLLRQAGRRLTIGAFFGPTPRNAADVARYQNWGAPRAGGYVCPFLRCPRCDGDLIWRSADATAGVEKLHCASAACGSTVLGEEVFLTRSRMATSPTDVLFTTTEMLNRQMGNSEYGHVFGLGPSVRRPQIMLLDEVHTYSGTSGAQVALLLRRWQHAVGSRVQFTGLSATLRAAAEFFSQLVGLRPGSVEEVSSKEVELDPVPESVEYVLALRGDPGTGTSLLSTSIQTALLLRRILDPANASPSAGLYGQRVFLFTDDLDVTNRLYNNLQDAEGLDSWGRRQPGSTVLASLRSAAQPDNTLRNLLGQSWQVCEDIGRPFGLTQPLRISRTSSQDSGVDQGSDVVVATAALEVDYNDPLVGGVMQHKAPRDWAAFLQRKRRAGRPRLMRPWTTVVLSDRPAAAGANSGVILPVHCSDAANAGTWPGNPPIRLPPCFRPPLGAAYGPPDTASDDAGGSVLRGIRGSRNLSDSGRTSRPGAFEDALRPEFKMESDPCG